MTDPISLLLLDKVGEQVERLDHLLLKVPEDQLDWRPDSKSFSVGELLGHLLECLAGFCAVLHKLHPERLAHFSRLRELPVNFRCPPDEARRRVQHYLEHIAEGFILIQPGELTRIIPTVFVKEGEAALTLLLGNLEHLINHKHQLFTYLKLMGISVSTSALYCLRGDMEVDQ
ncbi:MAG TPA: DinB family protein [Blastocatellia bacterium]|nr:DinB family protein [Blastocatellia bacterium]